MPLQRIDLNSRLLVVFKRRNYHPSNSERRREAVAKKKKRRLMKYQKKYKIYIEIKKAFSIGAVIMSRRHTTRYDRCGVSVKIRTLSMSYLWAPVYGHDLRTPLTRRDRRRSAGTVVYRRRRTSSGHGTFPRRKPPGRVDTARTIVVAVFSPHSDFFLLFFTFV